MGKKRITRKWAPNKAIDTVAITEGNHFATRSRLNDFTRLMRTLPDDDPVIRRLGKGIPELRKLLIDSHLESVWTVRCSTTAGAEWFVGAGGKGRKEKAAAEALEAELRHLDTPRIIEEMMEAVAYGYSPIEIIWEAHEGKWGIGNLVGKPSEWFEFDRDSRLVFREGISGQEDLPENRFLVVQHHASYANPYGSKVFSKCFWPVTFKRKGWEWWTVFVEKYGGAFIHGQYPKNADEKYKGELLNALQQMISDAVAITQEGSEINIISAGDKGGSTNVHAEYIKLANAEISKAVLGETLTTEIGDKGSYAAAQAHNLVRKDLATADRRRMSAAFNRLSSVYTFYNFGAEVAAPKFEFVRDEDLQQDRAKRDKEIYGIGWRPRKSYITREYGIPEEDYDLDFKVVQSQGGDTTKSFAENHTTPCRCHEHDRGITKRIAALFGSKAEKAALKDERLMQEFAEQTLEAGQDELDGTIESYIDALGTVTTYEEGKQAIQKAYQRRVFSPLAHLIDVVRYAAAGIGNHQKRRVKHG